MIRLPFPRPALTRKDIKTVLVRSKAYQYVCYIFMYFYLHTYRHAYEHART
jgi:hypothetical protein